MPNVTALQLVNRVLVLSRQDVVADFGQSPAIEALECVNLSVSHVLSMRKHSFSLRHDGELVTKPRITLASGTTVLTNGSNTVAFTAYGGSASDFQGDFATRMLVPSDASYGSTSFRVRKSDVQLTVGAFDLYTPWPGTGGTPEIQTFAAEYMLPDTVMSVESVTLEETPLRLKQVDESRAFEELVPRPHDTDSDPIQVMVGGYDVGTYNLSGVEPDALLRIVVWPVPTASVVLRYSYYMRNPRLQNTTDVLQAVPDEWINEIVQDGAAKYRSYMEQDPERGLALEQAAIARARSLSDRPDAGRRRVIQSWGSGMRERNFLSRRDRVIS